MDGEDGEEVDDAAMWKRPRMSKTAMVRQPIGVAMIQSVFPATSRVPQLLPHQPQHQP